MESERTNRRCIQHICQRRAFTLIELLVVVSIIALLVSILLPALGSAREAARMTICATNLRTVGMAIIYYADDNDNFLPPGFGYHGMPDVPNASWQDKNYWVTAISEYIKSSYHTSENSSSVMHCPTKRPWPPRSKETDGALNYAMATRLSTVLNYYGGPDADKNWRRIDSIKTPSANIAVLDLWWGHPIVGLDGIPQYAQDLGIIRPMIHKGRDNFLFLDAHVEPLRQDEEFSGGYVTNY